MLAQTRTLLERLGLGFDSLLEVDLKEGCAMATFIVPRAVVWKTWQALRDASGESGLVPLILGGMESFAAHLETLGLAFEEPELAIDPLLEEAAMVVLPDLIASRLEIHLCEEGEWPGGSSADSSGGSGGSRDFGPLLPEDDDLIYMGLIRGPLGKPVNPSELPVWLLFGGFADCPQPFQHPAWLKHWEHRYGAVVSAIGADYLSCTVERPPGAGDRSAAMELAREQYAYCPSVVEDGGGTLAEHAATLVESRHWLLVWS